MRYRTWIVILLGLILEAAVQAEERGPLTVSPGGGPGVARVADRCPTFSWAGSSGARSYTLVVYRLPDEATAEDSREAPPVVRVTLPGSATSWTPSLEQCLEPASGFAWSIRAHSESGVSAWSRPALFRVETGTSEAAFRQALTVVQAYLARSAEIAGADRVEDSGSEGTVDGISSGYSTRARPAARSNPLQGVPDKTSVKGEVADLSGVTFGVHGISNSSDDSSSGVVGQSTATSGETAGVVGVAASDSGVGVLAEATSTSGFTIGLEATVQSASGLAGQFTNSGGGQLIGGSDGATQVFFVDGIGNLTFEGVLSGNGTGAHSLGGMLSTMGLQVTGNINATSGVQGQILTSIGDTQIGGNAVVAGTIGASGLGQSSVNGDFSVGGMLTKSSGMFRIDHPLDPANKYLQHSFVESPDMKNVYDGIADLDEKGSARVTLPDWFEALNDEFRYQLTALGSAMPGLYIAEELVNNTFRVAGGSAGGRVSWQVTGIRQDAYARAYRIQVEEEKPEGVKGTYLHPELYRPERDDRIELTPKRR